MSADFEDTGEPVRIPITDVFDLHSVPPRDVQGVVEAYWRRRTKRASAPYASFTAAASECSARSSAQS